MQFCPFCIIAPFNDYCRCKKTGDICPLTRRCMNDMKWKPLNSMATCAYRLKEEKMNKNEYKVRFAIKDKLYVEIDDYVKEIDNPFDTVPQKVELVWVEGEPYVKGYELKKITKKDKEENKEKGAN